MVKALFLILFVFSIQFANAKRSANPKKANLVDFCKEISSMVNAGRFGDGQVNELINYTFSKDLKVLESQKFLSIKNRILKIRDAGFETPSDVMNGCADEFENDFSNFVGRVLSKKDVFKEDESYLTHEQRIKAYTIINPVGDGDEKIEAPISVNGLCSTKETNDCGTDLPIGLKPLEDVASYATISYQAFSVSDCECYLNNSTSNREKIISQAPNEMKEIDHAILGAAGENFLNQYAAFYEDIGFYEANSPWALKKKKAEKGSPIGEDVLCIDPDLFKKAIDESCEKNGTSQGKEERMSEILGAFGNDFSGGGQNFAEKFELLKYDIETTRVLKPKWRSLPGMKPKLDVPAYNPVPFVAGNEFNPDKFKLTVPTIDFKYKTPSFGNTDPMGAYSLDMWESFTRADFEKTRFAYAVDLPEVSVVDELIGIIIRDQELKATLDGSMKNNGFPITPLAAIESMLTDNGGDTKLISKIIKKLGQTNKNEATIKLLKASLEDKSFNKQRENIFKTALATHPGLKNIVLDANLFNKAVENVSGNNKGIVRQAERNKDLFEHFSNRCKGLQEKLAEAVCTNTAALKNKVNTQDLVSILKGKGMLPSKDKKVEEAVNLTLCSMNDNNVPTTSIFNGLNSKDPLLMSDFKERKFSTDPSKAKNMFSSFAWTSAKDPAYKKDQEKVIQAVSYVSTSAGQIRTSTGFRSLGNSPFSSSSNSDAVEPRNLFANGKSTGLTDSKITNSNHKEESSTGQARLENISKQANNATAVNNAVQPVTQFSSSAVTPSSKISEVKDSPVQEELVSPIREELKNTLKNADQKKINGFLGNITDEDAKELLRLKEQKKKNREEISALKLDQEKLKTQEMKAQYEALEKKLELLKEEKNSVSRHNSSSGSSTVINRKEKSESNERFSQFSDKTNITGFQATGGSGGESASTSAGNAQAQTGQFRDPSSTSSAAASRDSDSKNEMSLVIKSQSVKGKVSEDPSVDLISYLTKNETDSKTLRELKESGLIYTYEIDENGKTVQMKKVIKYTELSVEAKALVDKKISILVKKESADIEHQILTLKRTYSIQALKLEILSANHSKL